MRTARWRYRFESFMSRGGAAIFISLLVLFLTGLTVAGTLRLLVWWFLPGLEGDWGDHLWNIFLAMTDPGNMGVDEQASGWLRASAVAAGFMGVVIFSMLIAFITTALDTLLHEFRKGRSLVVEAGQTVILGWGERVVDIVRELVIANESERDACVVILAERDKEEMEDHLAAMLPDTKSTRLVCRTGSTSTIASLRRISVGSAKSAIVLATCPDSAGEDDKRVSDARVIKTVLALIASQPGGANRIPIVAELFFADSRAVLETLGDPRITCFDSREMLGKILVQTSRTSGLAVVYNELLSFDGCELYLYSADWRQARFYDALWHFVDGVVLGIRRADGRLELRPAPDAVLGEGDQVLIVAEDNSTVAYQARPVATPGQHPFALRRLERRVERELILGWHPIAQTVVAEYADYLPQGSTITIVAHQPSERVRAHVAALAERLPALGISLVERNPLDMAQLRALEPFGYDNVIILSQSEDPSPEKTDAETMVILLLLRKVVRDAGVAAPRTKLITQILDSANYDLISQAHVDDFLISNRLATMILAQLSEQPGMKQVYDDLFQAEGSEVYLKPAELYFPQLPVELPFCDLIGQALKREEICFGYRLSALAADPERNFGVKLNPAKDALVRLAPGDALVVLAEDDR